MFGSDGLLWVSEPSLLAQSQRFLLTTLGVTFALILTLDALSVHREVKVIFLRKVEVPGQAPEFPINGREPSSLFLPTQPLAVLALSFL